MKNKTFITTLFVIAITLCLSGCKYSNEAVSSIISDLGLESAVNNLGASINPATNQIQNVLTDTYWESSKYHKGSLAFDPDEDSYDFDYDRAEDFLKGLFGMSEQPPLNAMNLIFYHAYISGNTITFFHDVDKYDFDGYRQKVREKVAISNSFSFTSDGARGVIYDNNNERYDIEVEYINDSVIKISICQGHEAKEATYYKMI